MTGLGGPVVLDTGAVLAVLRQDPTAAGAVDLLPVGRIAALACLDLAFELVGVLTARTVLDDLAALGVTIEPMTAADVAASVALAQDPDVRAARISPAGIASAVLARRLGAVLVTADPALRECSDPRFVVGVGAAAPDATDATGPSTS